VAVRAEKRGGPAPRRRAAWWRPTGCVRAPSTRRLAPAALLVLLAGCAGGPGGRNAEAEGRALRYAEAIGGRDTAVLHRLVTEDYVLHAAALPGGEVRGRQAFLDGVASRTRAWPPGRITVTQFLSSGEQVASFGTFEPGASPLERGRAQSVRPGIRVAAIHRVRDGRIAETWAVWDTRALERLTSPEAAADSARDGSPP
jgi:ketosteroid isomerase-like protein